MTEIEELRLEKERYRMLLNATERRLSAALDKCALYEKIAKERAQRARKKVSDPSGYVCKACREIIDYYEESTPDGKKKQRKPVKAYRTTLSMPYPSQLGFAELRRLLEVDLVGSGMSLIGFQDAARVDGVGYRIGIDRIPEGLPLEGKHPGPLYEDHPDPAPCVLYRVALNIGKRFAEADLYTTEPVIIPVEMME